MPSSCRLNADDAEAMLKTGNLPAAARFALRAVEYSHGILNPQYTHAKAQLGEVAKWNLAGVPLPEYRRHRPVAINARPPVMKKSRTPLIESANGARAF